MSHRYAYSGVLVEADFVVPEWRAFACDDLNPPDIVLRQIAEISDAPPHNVPGAWDGKSLSFSIEGEGSWAVSDGREIRVAPADPARMDDARLFTLGSAWGALGYQRGWTMLHGSAVNADGATGVFCGDADQGKSTLAASLVRRGAALVADDLSRVDIAEARTPLIHPSAARIKLWDSAIAHLGWEGREMQQDHFRDRKFHVPLETGLAASGPLRIDAVFVLEWGDTLSCEALRGIEAVRALVRASMYRREFLELMGRLPDHVVACTRMASALPVYRLTRPRDLARIDAVCALVEEKLLHDHPA